MLEEHGCLILTSKRAKTEIWAYSLYHGYWRKNLEVALLP